jgi:glycine betaine/proline transport system ATP-binding protein
VIEVRSLWKVFGPGDHGRAIAESKRGSSRADILATSGQTIGVRDVSFEVASGESFVVMGLSGSGKSTLIRCMSGLQSISAGDVVIDGTSLVGISEERLRDLRRSKFAMVFQHFGLFPHRKVIDNAAYGLEVQGVSKDVRRRKAGEILSLVGLDGWADHYPDQLSGGMQQRVGLARALALDPEILFFDEPFSALDPLIRHDMQNELLRLQHEQRRTIVFITHDFDEALRLGDRVAVMKDGVFEQVGTAEQVVAKPATPYVAAFTRDVSIAKVLKVHSVMSRLSSADSTGPSATSRSVNADQSLESILPMFLTDLSPLLVLAPSGSIIGEVSGSAVAAALTGRPA